MIRRNPYKASFIITPANKIDPASGASECAKGNQRWKGTKGVLIQSAMKMPTHIRRLYPVKGYSNNTILVEPLLAAISRIASNINREPTRVYKKK